MNIDNKLVIKAAKNLVDNRDFAVVMEYMENDLLLKLTQGSPDDADGNLRNYKASQALKTGIGMLANAPTEDS